MTKLEEIKARHKKISGVYYTDVAYLFTLVENAIEMAKQIQISSSHPNAVTACWVALKKTREFLEQTNYTAEDLEDIKAARKVLDEK